MTAPATITIPAAYLEYARSAIIAEIQQGSKYIDTNQDAILAADTPEWAKTCRLDLASSVRFLHADMSLLEQLLDADGVDTKITGEHGAVTTTLDAIARVLSNRLDDACGYAPVPMGDVFELSAAMRWAAEEALRIDPGLDERKAA